MKLAFSTLGCPDWRWGDIYSTAKDLRFDGIEIRGVANEMYVPRIRTFDAEHLEQARAQLQASGLEIPMLTSGICLEGEKEDAALAEAREYMDLAQKLETPYIRVMITGKPQPEPADLERAAEVYRQMCAYGAACGVTPLIETNGALADSREMARFLERTGSENQGVLWDIHHPFRFFGEDPHETYRSIGEAVRYVHVKDSVRHGDVISYRMMGYGDVPVFDALKVLNENRYDGYISLEWVKRWNPDLEEPGIVFAHYMDYMMFLLERL